jgi:hypothetical protein
MLKAVVVVARKIGIDSCVSHPFFLAAAQKRPSLKLPLSFFSTRRLEEYCKTI